MFHIFESVNRFQKWLNLSAGVMRYGKNTLWLIAERLSRIAAGLFVGVFVARYLGPEQFGALNFITAFVGLFASIAGLGLDVILVKELVQFPERKNQLLGTAFVLKVFGAILMWGAILLVLLFTQHDAVTKALICIVAFGSVFQAFDVVDFHYQAIVRSDLIVKVKLILIVISSAVKLWLIYINASMAWFAAVITFDLFLQAIGYSIIFYRNSGSFAVWAGDISTAKGLLKKSWPLILSGVVISVYMGIDKVMINEMLGPEEVGFYSIAVIITSIFYFIPTVITQSIYPYIIEVKSDTSLYFSTLQKIHDAYFILGAVITAGVLLVSDWVVTFLYGEAFAPSIEILNVYIFAVIFIFHGAIRGHFYILENKQLLATMFRVIGLLINILLNFLFIKEFGVIGAAYATVISFVVPPYFFVLSDKVTRTNVSMMIKSYLCIFRWGYKWLR